MAVHLWPGSLDHRTQGCNHAVKVGGSVWATDGARVEEVAAPGFSNEGWGLRILFFLLHSRVPTRRSDEEPIAVLQVPSEVRRASHHFPPSGFGKFCGSKVRTVTTANRVNRHQFQRL